MLLSSITSGMVLLYITLKLTRFAFKHTLRDPTRVVDGPQGEQHGQDDRAESSCVQFVPRVEQRKGLPVYRAR